VGEVNIRKYIIIIPRPIFIYKRTPSHATNFSNISFSAVLFCEKNALWNTRMILFFSSFLKITRRAMSDHALQLSTNSLIARLNSPATHCVQTGRDNALIIARWYFVVASGRICFKKGCSMKSAIQPNYGPRPTMFALLFHLFCRLLASFSLSQYLVSLYLFDSPTFLAPLFS